MKTEPPKYRNIPVRQETFDQIEELVHRAKKTTPYHVSKVGWMAELIEREHAREMKKNPANA